MTSWYITHWYACPAPCSRAPQQAKSIQPVRRRRHQWGLAIESDFYATGRSTGSPGACSGRRLLAACLLVSPASSLTALTSRGANRRLQLGGRGEASVSLPPSLLLPPLMPVCEDQITTCASLLSSTRSCCPDDFVSSVCYQYCGLCAPPSPPRPSSPPFLPCVQGTTWFSTPDSTPNIAAVSTPLAPPCPTTTANHPAALASALTSGGGQGGGGEG